MPRVRSIFLSDIHLGTRACQAERLVEFLREHAAEHIFLIGDIVDFWAMSRSICWKPSHNTVVQKLLRRARRGERVVLIPGNHDEALRDYCGVVFGDIEVASELVHETADGKRFLLIHGDQFDQVTRHHRWVAMLDPVELADGSGQRPGSATVLSDLHAGDRHGRLTWWAVVREGPGYDPRCTCCALLDGPLADCLDTDEGGSRARGAPPPDDLPTRWSVGLDRATGIVVSLQPLDGTSLAGGFEVRLHGVDEDLDPGRFR